MRTPSSEHPTGPGGGWVKLHRKLLEWEWYQDAHMVHLLVHLLLTASHEERRYKGLTIKRGQVVTSIKELAEALGASETSTRRRMKRLKSGGFLTIKVAHRITTITICNYDSYQTKEKSSGEIVAEKRRKNGGKVAESYNNRNNKKGRRSDEDNTSSLSPLPPHAREVVCKFSEVDNNRYRVEIANDAGFIQYATSNLHTNERTLLDLLAVFTSEVNAKKTPHTDTGHYRQHFYDWARRHFEKQKNNQKPTAHARHSDLSATLEADRAKYSRKS